MEGTQNLGISDSTGVSEVVYDTAGDQYFTVIIPKKIVLGSDKTAEYGVTVKGDVAQGSRVKVEPQDDVDERGGVNFVMTSSGIGGSENVDVTQNDLYWDYTEIVANDYEGTEKPGTVNGSELTFGIWQGDLTFLINFEDEYKDTGETEDYSGIEDWEYELDESTKTVTLKRYIKEYAYEEYNPSEEYNIDVHSKYNIDGTIYKARFSDDVGYDTNEYELFGDYKPYIDNIRFDDDFDTSNVTDMSGMFSNCNLLKSLDVSMFDTSNVTNMSCMFSGCEILQSLDVSMFDTSKVTNMESMFSDCRRLKSLDVSNFDTSNETDMGGMFDSCNYLPSLDVSNFDTSNVTNMGGMFRYCFEIESLDLHNFNTSNVTSMQHMFNECRSLLSLDLSNFDTSNVTDMQYMFYRCEKLSSLNLDSFNTSNVTDMSYMFNRCKSLLSLDLRSFDISFLQHMTCTFWNCESLQIIKVSQDWHVPDYLSDILENMFYNCGTDHVTYVD